MASVLRTEGVNSLRGFKSYRLLSFDQLDNEVKKMSTYHQTCKDCNDSTSTDSWTPIECPFCKLCRIKAELAGLVSSDKLEDIFKDQESRFAEYFG